jgi:methylmalonyl-CoA mutase
LDQVWGRHVASTQTVSGAYVTEFGETAEITSVMHAIAQFEEEEGRRPRILVAKVSCGWVLLLYMWMAISMALLVA